MTGRGKYRRGFKTEANEIARQTREELGLRLVDPLDPRLLADHLAIPLLPLCDLQRECPAVTHFLKVEPSAFSALTVFRGSSRLVIYNDSHAPQRQSSDIAHELSHALLFHPPAPALDGRGCRYWDQRIEDEATWLAGALLISEEAAIDIVRRNLPLKSAAEAYGVSVSMVRFRVNVTAARRRVRRASRAAGT